MAAQLLKDYMDENDLSQSQVAAQMGRSTATVNQYLQSKYKGDVKAIDKLVIQLIERARSKAQDVATDFVETPTAKRILEICGLAHAVNDVYLVIGDAGLGKTVSLKRYAQLNANVVMLEVDPTFSAKVLLAELCIALGLQPSRNNHENMQSIIKKLKGSERLLIVDEAELLTNKPLEVLRRIHDKSGIGMVLAGMPRLRANLRGARGQYKQLYSRIGLALDLKDKLPQEDIGMLCESVLGTDAFNSRLNAVSDGNARRLNKLCRGINRLSVLNGKPIDNGMINKFAEMLID